MFLDFVGAREGELCRRRLTLVAKPTKKIDVDTTATAPSYIPDALPVANPGLWQARGTAGFDSETFKLSVA